VVNMSKKNSIFQTNKQDHSTSRITEQRQEQLKQNQILVDVEKFAFTSNNITYAVLGEMVKYWEFFPVKGQGESNWGVIPVWGYARIVESKLDDLPVGSRFFGYFPPAESLLMAPQNINPNGFIDGSEHRESLPAGYNFYYQANDHEVINQQEENEHMMFYPLFVTAFCLHSMLKEKGWYDAEQILIISASSKTSIGLAYALREDRDAPMTIGLTSTKNLNFVRSSELYDKSVSYEGFEKIDANKKTVIIDMSGNTIVLKNLHLHLGDNMCFTSNVGITHWRNLDRVDGIIRERSEMFFAPAYMASLIKKYGKNEYGQRTSEFVKSTSKKIREWMHFREVDGLNGLEEIYGSVCSGDLLPNEGLIIKI